MGTYISTLCFLSGLFCLLFFVFCFFGLVLLATHCALLSYCYKKNSDFKSNRDRI